MPPGQGIHHIPIDVCKPHRPEKKLRYTLRIQVCHKVKRYIGCSMEQRNTCTCTLSFKLRMQAQHKVKEIHRCWHGTRIKAAPSVNNFKSLLKTHLFSHQLITCPASMSTVVEGHNTNLMSACLLDSLIELSTYEHWYSIVYYKHVHGTKVEIY